MARTEILMPEAEIRATRVFGADGTFLRTMTPGRIVAAMIEHPHYESIRAQVAGASPYVFLSYWQSVLEEMGGFLQSPVPH